MLNVPLLKLFVLLQVAAFTTRQRLRSGADERGSVTTEHVIWAVAVIAIVGGVVAAVKGYVEAQAGKLK
jgi:hypothetical protein